MISSFYEKIVGASPPTEPDVPKILCVGIICLDMVQICQQFPSEDSTQRCVEYRWQRGGNASNTCTVLSLLRQPCELLCCLSAEEHVNFLQNDLRKYKINFSHCPMIEDIGCPISTVILSLSTGTRTILYYNQNLPELTLKNFEQLDLEEYSWIHFEGRNLNEVLSMIQRIESYNNSLNNTHDQNTNNRMPITISVELERPKTELLDLLPYADLAFIAKDFAKSQGFDNMSETIKSISQYAKSGATIICAWADRGAMACTPNGIIVQSPAFPPPKVIDTLGAGDTFNAAVLHYLNRTKLNFMRKHEERIACMNDTQTKSEVVDDRAVYRSDIKQNYNIESLEYSRTEFIDEIVLQEAITFACRIAGAKVGLKGYDGIDKISANIL